MKIDGEQLKMFKELETKLHTKEVRNSREQVGELLADDFIEFGKSGKLFDKQTTLDMLSGEETDLEISVSDFAARSLAPDVVLVTYTSSQLDVDGATTVSALRSSIWVQRSNKWQMTFHQGTKTP